jgi:type II secretory pathway component PulF
MSDSVPIELVDQREIAAKAYRCFMLACGLLEQSRRLSSGDRQKVSAAHSEAFGTLTTSLTRIGELGGDIYQSPSRASDT